MIDWTTLGNTLSSTLGGRNAEDAVSEIRSHGWVVVDAAKLADGSLFMDQPVAAIDPDAHEAAHGKTPVRVIALLGDKLLGKADVPWNDYVIFTGPDCHVSYLQHFPKSGTVQLTIKREASR